MDIQDLRYALILEKCCNFSEAAALCDISQSSFSKHIQKIEDELNGVKLFDRSARPLKITAAGREFIAYAKEIVDSYDCLERAMKKYDRQYQKEIVVGTLPILGPLGILKLVRAFSDSLKDGAKVTIRDMPNKELISGLHDGSLDIAFLIQPDGKWLNSDITYYKLKYYEFLLVVNESNPLARLKTANWSDLAGQHFISQDESTQAYEIYKEGFMRHGLDWSGTTCLRNIPSIVESVEVGAGITMLSAPVISSYRTKNIKTIPMNEPLLYTITAAHSTRQGLKPLARKFIDFLLESTID